MAESGADFDGINYEAINSFAFCKAPFAAIIHCSMEFDPAVAERNPLLVICKDKVMPLQFLRLARIPAPCPNADPNAVILRTGWLYGGVRPQIFPADAVVSPTYLESLARVVLDIILPACAPGLRHPRRDGSAQRLMHSMVLFQHSWKDCLDEYLCGKQRETACYPPVNQAARTYKR